MKKLLIALAVLCAVSNSTNLFADQTRWQKFKQSASDWWVRNKAKVAKAVGIGITVAGVAVVAGGTAYHVNKTQKAIEDAHVSQEALGQAVAWVGLLGPIGYTRALNVIKNAFNKEIISPEAIEGLYKNKILSALGKYFNNYSFVKAVLSETGFSHLENQAKQYVPGSDNVLANVYEKLLKKFKILDDGQDDGE